MAHQQKKLQDQAKATTNTAYSTCGSTFKAAELSSTQTQMSQPNGPGKLLLIKKIHASQLTIPPGMEAMVTVTRPSLRC